MPLSYEVETRADGYQYSVKSGKRLGRKQGQKTDGNVSGFKDACIWVFNQMGGRKNLLKYMKKDEAKKFPQLLTMLTSFQAREIFQTNTEKTEIHVITAKAQEFLDKIEEEKKLHLVKKAK